MECKNCEKKHRTTLYLLKGGKKVNAQFCSYGCYLDFWNSAKNFIPLPKYIKNNKRRI